MAEKSKRQISQAAEPIGLEGKILDPKLAKFAQGSARRKRVVLLTINAPAPKLKIGPKRQIGRQVLRKRHLSYSTAEKKLRQQRTKQVLTELDEVGVHGSPLSSGTIIAKVSPKQLRSIVRSDLVKSIAPSAERTLETQ